MNKKDISLIRNITIMRSADSKYKIFDNKYKQRILQYLENKQLTKWNKTAYHYYINSNVYLIIGLYAVDKDGSYIG